MRHRLQGLATMMAVALVLPSVWAGQDDSAASSAVAGPEFAASIAPRLRMEPKRTAEGRGRALWIASVAALTVANVADAKSSWNKNEANRVLAGGGGRFGARGAAIKGGINAAWVAGQVMALRKNRAHRRLAVVNFAAASILGAIAFRNRSIAGPGGGGI